MRSVDPKLTNVTAMTLRASYATSMLHSYRQGEFAEENLTEEQFLEVVAKQMNTSVEQLQNTYMAAYSMDFKQDMRLFTRHFSVTMNEQDDEKEDYVDREYPNESQRNPLPIPNPLRKRGAKRRSSDRQSLVDQSEEDSQEDRELERRVLFPDELEESQ